MFAYGGNNPVNMYDPDGACSRFLGFLWKVDCGKVDCPESKEYDPSASVVAVLYDSRSSGFLRLINGQGFKDQGEQIAKDLQSLHIVECYPYTNMNEFVDSWNSLNAEYDKIYVIGHGYAGGMSCAGQSISNSSEEAYSFGDLKTVSATTVYLYVCNGATIDGKGNSVAFSFAYLTNGSVWAISNGKLSYDYWTLVPYPTRGGSWSVTKGNTTTAMP